MMLSISGRTKALFTFLGPLIIVIAIPITVIAVQRTTQLVGKAATDPGCRPLNISLSPSDQSVSFSASHSQGLEKVQIYARKSSDDPLKSESWLLVGEADCRKKTTCSGSYSWPATLEPGTSYIVVANVKTSEPRWCTGNFDYAKTDPSWFACGSCSATKPSSLPPGPSEDCKEGSWNSECGYAGKNWCKLGTECDSGWVDGPQVDVSCPPDKLFTNTGTYCERGDGKKRFIGSASGCKSDPSCPTTPKPAPAPAPTPTPTPTPSSSRPLQAHDLECKDLDVLMWSSDQYVFVEAKHPVGLELIQVYLRKSGDDPTKEESWALLGEKNCGGNKECKETFGWPGGLERGTYHIVANVKTSERRWCTGNFDYAETDPGWFVCGRCSITKQVTVVPPKHPWKNRCQEGAVQSCFVGGSCTPGTQVCKVARGSPWHPTVQGTPQWHPCEAVAGWQGEYDCQWGKRSCPGDYYQPRGSMYRGCPAPWGHSSLRLFSWNNCCVLGCNKVQWLPDTCGPEGSRVNAVSCGVKGSGEYNLRGSCVLFDGSPGICMGRRCVRTGGGGGGKPAPPKFLSVIGGKTTLTLQDSGPSTRITWLVDVPAKFVLEWGEKGWAPGNPPISWPVWPRTSSYQAGGSIQVGFATSGGIAGGSPVKPDTIYELRVKAKDYWGQWSTSEVVEFGPLEWRPRRGGGGVVVDFDWEEWADTCENLCKRGGSAGGRCKTVDKYVSEFGVVRYPDPCKWTLGEGRYRLIQKWATDCPSPMRPEKFTDETKVCCCLSKHSRELAPSCEEVCQAKGYVSGACCHLAPQGMTEVVCWRETGGYEGWKMSAFEFHDKVRGEILDPAEAWCSIGTGCLCLKQDPPRGTPFGKGGEGVPPSPAGRGAGADLDGDGGVGILDFGLFIEDYGKSGEDIPADFNSDGAVNILDFSRLLGEYARNL